MTDGIEEPILFRLVKQLFKFSTSVDFVLSAEFKNSSLFPYHSLSVSSSLKCLCKHFLNSNSYEKSSSSLSLISIRGNHSYMRNSLII